MTQAFKGVNLGGWLVAEKWITPSLFKGTMARNEFELSNTKEGRRRIKDHHQTFIQQADLDWLKAQNVKLLRVPVGYWIFGGDKRYIAAIDRLDWLVDTSLSMGFKVLIDLHAAPDAQNRAEHSGSGNTVSEKHSTKWLSNKSAQQETVEILSQLAERYRDSPAIWGIQLLNEPAIDFTGMRLASFHRRAYRALSKVARPGTHIVFSDAYAPLRTTNTFWLMAKSDYPVAMDMHIYQTFSRRDKQRSFMGHLRKLRRTKWLLWFYGLQQPLMIGEWSGMLPINEGRNATKRYIAKQLSVYEGVIAQCYWTYKTENDGRWNYRDACEKGLIQ